MPRTPHTEAMLLRVEAESLPPRKATLRGTGSSIVSHGYGAGPSSRPTSRIPVVESESRLEAAPKEPVLLSDTSAGVGDDIRCLLVQFPLLRFAPVHGDVSGRHK